MSQTAVVIQFPDGTDIKPQQGKHHVEARMEQDNNQTEAMPGGFLKLHRTLQDASFAGRPEYMAAWIHILMLATHKPRKAMLGNASVSLTVGQFISGRKALAERVGVTEKQMRGLLSFFEKEGMISKLSSRAGTIFTVCNYSIYNEKQGQEGPTLLGHQKGQANPSNSGASSKSGANEKAIEGPTERATTQEHKNISKDININCSLFDDQPEKPKKKTRKPAVRKPQEFKDLFAAYPNHRKGGTDKSAWDAWKSESLTPDDAIEAITWLTAASASRPDTWGQEAQGQYCLGITNFIRNRTWKAPVPLSVNPQSRPYQTPDFQNTDYSVGAEGFEHV